MDRHSIRRIDNLEANQQSILQRLAELEKQASVVPPMPPSRKADKPSRNDRSLKEALMAEAQKARLEGPPPGAFMVTPKEED